MNPDFPAVFALLRGILQQHANEFHVSTDTTTGYCLEAPVGPATIRAWRGKTKMKMIPVAWVQSGKSYVSYHHMALYGNSKLRDGLSEELSRRMQGKTCFNFRVPADVPLSELQTLTARGLAAMRSDGFIQ
jgi:hypothetical protein